MFAFKKLFKVSSAEEIESAENNAQSTDNVKNREGRTVLHKAAAANNVTLLNELLADNRLQIDAQTNNKETALLLATRAGHEQIVALLREKKASKMIANNLGELPLHFAASKESNTLTLLLIDRETVNVITNNGENPLHYAVAAGSLENVRSLLKEGAQVDLATNPDSIFSGSKALSTCPASSTAFHYALVRTNFDIIRELMKYKFNPALQNQRGETVGYLALSHKQANLFTNEELQALLAKETATKLTNTKESVFHAAAKNKQINKKQFDVVLSAVKPNRTLIDAQDSTGKTALIHAVIQQQYDKVESLSAWADLDIEDHAGFSAIVYAALQGDNQMLQKLADGKADFSAEAGQLAIKKALLNNHVSTVIKLITLGANPNTHIYPKIKNSGYSKVSSISSISSSSRSSSSENDGKDLSGCIDAGDTPLHFAVKTENVQLAEACLEKDKSLVNVCNAKGKTPPYYALRVFSNIATILSSKGNEFDEKTLDPRSSSSDQRFRTLEMAGASRHFSKVTIPLFFKGELNLTEKQLAQKEKEIQKYRRAQNPAQEKVVMNKVVSVAVVESESQPQQNENFNSSSNSMSI